MTMTYGYTTKKTKLGFVWKVDRYDRDENIRRGVRTILQSGLCATRAQAVGIAKKWVLFYRRVGKFLPNPTPDRG